MLSCNSMPRCETLVPRPIPSRTKAYWLDCAESSIFVRLTLCDASAPTSTSPTSAATAGIPPKRR